MKGRWSRGSKPAAVSLPFTPHRIFTDPAVSLQAFALDLTRSLLKLTSGKAKSAEQLARMIWANKATERAQLYCPERTRSLPRVRLSSCSLPPS